MNDPLAPGERQAYNLAQQGLSTRTIATHLNRSRSTIRSQLENARRKLANQKAPHDKHLDDQSPPTTPSPSSTTRPNPQRTNP